MNAFDPNGPGVPGYLFGIPNTELEAEIIIIPVPWEVTTSFGSGTAKAPEAILKASCQIDLLIPEINNAWKIGYFIQPPDQEISKENIRLKSIAEQSRVFHNRIKEQTDVREVNVKSTWMVENIREKALKVLNNNKMLGVLGGDHSVSLGLIHALQKRNKEFGILQIDAHSDMRSSYEGFKFSHASVMFNAMKSKQISHLIQVGVRDWCEEEENRINNDHRVSLFSNQYIQQELFENKGWGMVVEEIIDALPAKVYVSFDIDGLDPKLCPNTGTPVPGGLSYEMAEYLIRRLVLSKREIIGFDLCEVGNKEWDANVGARVLFILSNYMAVSQGKLKV